MTLRSLKSNSKLPKIIQKVLLGRDSVANILLLVGELQRPGHLLGTTFPLWLQGATSGRRGGHHSGHRLLLLPAGHQGLQCAGGAGHQLLAAAALCGRLLFAAAWPVSSAVVAAPAAAAAPRSCRSAATAVLFPSLAETGYCYLRYRCPKVVTVHR